MSRINGAWQRVSIASGDAAPTEVSDVWWLMSGDHFADFRILRDGLETNLPYSATQAFAGTYTYDGASARMRWHHLADTERRSPDIEGTIRIDPINRRLMYEEGDDFSEVWARIDTDGSTSESSCSDRVIAVRVGSYAIAMDILDNCAGRYLMYDDRCVDIDAIGKLPLSAAQLWDLFS